MAIGQSYYKYRLWLGSLDGCLLNDRQKRLLLWLLGFGKDGCDSYNYRIAQELRTRYKNPKHENIPVSIRTIQYDLRHLEYHHLIITKTGWAELKNGKFIKQLRPRRIYVTPYATKRQWQIESIHRSLTHVSTKSSTLHRRRRHTPAWQQRKALLAAR